MSETPDPLNEALREATLAVLLGSTSVPTQNYDQFGNPFTGMVTIEGAFVARIRQQAQNGNFDDLIRQAMAKITPDDVVEVIKNTIGEQVLRGFEPVSGSYGSKPTPGWLQQQARSIAVEACTTALAADEGLLDTLRAKIGAEVDRNRVGITVNLSDPESS